jgi:hypothetical protein
VSAPPVTSTDHVAPPGWYADPVTGSGRRYWDGTAWTQQVAPEPSAPAPVSLGLVVAGYVLALLIPIVGFVLGVVALKKHPGTGTNHGVWIIVAAVVGVVLNLMLLTAGGSA